MTQTTLNQPTNVRADSMQGDAASGASALFCMCPRRLTSEVQHLGLLARGVFYTLVMYQWQQGGTLRTMMRSLQGY